MRETREPSLIESVMENTRDYHVIMFIVACVAAIVMALIIQSTVVGILNGPRDVMRSDGATSYTITDQYGNAFRCTDDEDGETIGCVKLSEE